ncbi:NAD(P)-binding protein [Patellaria atrata CBS 101060]|uniref:NADP-dependent mannitol dehydrogenase n=1 Tax=Patellaria atrata CBS 101060 TaxID=1346257 RepID=A0A9P4S7U9_9PEZI|nr:NAD(P)-binding protein [Patellaria atrata CBS 101060]
MFTSRHIPRLASLATNARFFRNPTCPKADVIRAKEVPVVSFKDGERASVDLPIDSPGLDPVIPPGVDVKQVAYPLAPSNLKGLTPTLKKFTLHGKVAVVTGGGRGLGFNMAQALAEVGVKGIAIMDRQQDVGEAAAKELSEQAGVDARFYAVDVRDGAAIDQAVHDISDHFGQIDVLINSAGIADSNIKAENYGHGMFRNLIDINVTGTFLVAQAVARQMIKNKTRGTMIFIASMSGSIVNYPQEQSAYNTSKAAVVQLTKSLATEWARYGIRVNAISPGYMDTALNRVPTLDAQKKIWIENTPQKRLGAVDDLNNLAVFLATDSSAFSTGSNYVIDGGYTLW